MEECLRFSGHYIESLIDMKEWHEIHVFKNIKKRLDNIKLVKQINKIISNHKPIESVFIGEYRSKLMRHVTNKSSPKKKYLLDDGNYSLSGQKQILLKKGECTKYSFLRKIYHKILGINDQDILDINFFSIYDLNISSHTQHRFIKNKYSQVRKLLSVKQKENYVLFLGNNTSEKGIISEKYYFHYLKRIQKYYPNISIKYFPHRLEDQEKVNRIEKELGFEILCHNKPVELFLLEGISIPYRLASFFSSALDNCYYLLGSKLQIDSFYVPLHHIQRADIKEQVKLNYQLYDTYKENFQVIDLERH